MTSISMFQNVHTVGINGATITAFSDQRVFNTITQAVITVAKAKSGRWKKSLERAETSLVASRL